MFRVCMWEVALKSPHGRLAQLFRDGNWVHGNIDDVVQDWFVRRAWTGYFMFNDEDPVGLYPEEHSHSCGHVKGVIAYDISVAVYLLHSVPCWPRTFPPETIPDDQTVYGQSFCMVWVDAAQLPALVQNLSLTDPNVYAHANFPFFRGPVHSPGQISHWRPDAALTYIAKNKRWNRDIYADGLLNCMGGPLRVQSWLRPPDPEAREGVVDVRTVTWDNGTQYHSSKDHSKYCASGTLTWFGSLNHMRSQSKRGGDGFVIEDAALTQAMNRLFDGGPVPEDHVNVAPVPLV